MEFDRENRTPESLRARFESHLMETFHEQRVFFREGPLQFHCTANLECDDWGLTVRIEPEIDRDCFTVSGAWSILSVWADRVGALYVNWSISLPETEE